MISLKLHEGILLTTVLFVYTIEPFLP